MTAFLESLGQIAGQFGINQLTANQQNRRIEKRLKEQRHYDSPKQQVQRLKEAGLSGSLMMAQGSAGQQSPAPVADIPETNIGREMGKYHETRFTKIQQELAKQTLRQETAKADLLENERDYDLSKATGQYFDENTGTMTIFDKNMTKQEERLEYNQIIAKYEPQIKQYELNFNRAKTDNEEKRILTQIELMLTQIGLSRREIRQYDVTEKIINSMKEGNFKKYIQGLIELIIYKVGK